MASHNDEYTMWSDDELASNSVLQYTRRGNTVQLQLDIIRGGSDMNNYVQGDIFSAASDFNESPMDGVLVLDNEHRFISTIAKIRPGSDWFSGLNSYSPVMDGMWLSSFTVDSFPWDAGVEDGTTYSNTNDVSDPKVNIFQYTVDTVPNNGVLLNAAGDDVLPVAQWKCDLNNGPAQEGESCGVDDTGRSFPDCDERLQCSNTCAGSLPSCNTCVRDDIICREDPTTIFFRFNREVNENCLWLSGRTENNRNRHCRRGRRSSPQPMDNTPLAKEACPMTCGSCPF